MIAAISAWVKDIILIVMFATFLEFLLPNSNMQRFIRVIMGLFIMLAILSPVIDLIQSRWTPTQVAEITTNSVASSEILSAANLLVSERDHLASELHKKDVAKQIQALVLAIDGVAAARVNVNFSYDKNLSKISNIEIYVKPGIATKNDLVGESTVPKIVVGSSPQNVTGDINAGLKEKIKGIIGELYQLHSEKIEVKPMN